jgi:hypothetical protein
VLINETDPLNLDTTRFTFFGIFFHAEGVYAAPIQDESTLSLVIPCVYGEKFLIRTFWRGADF